MCDKKKERLSPLFRLGSQLFLDLGALAHAAAQIVQLCTSDLTDADDFHLLHVRRMDRERLFNADAVGNSAYREGFGDSAAVLTDYGTLEQLDSLAVALFDLDRKSVV